MDANALVDRALALHQAGDLAGAEGAYRSILTMLPNLADIHYLLGMACLGQGRVGEAVQSLQAATALKPDGSGEWWHNLGVALRQAGDVAAALEAFGTAIAKCAGDPARQAGALAERGALLASQGDGAQAESDLRRALALVPDQPAARGNLAAVLYNRFADASGLERPGADAALAEAVRLAPERGKTWHRLGLALLKAERPQQALDAFNAARERGQEGLDLLLARADALAVLGRFDEARDLAIQAIAMAPGAAGPQVAHAAALHGLGALADAEAALRRALAAEPSNVAALLNLGNVLGDRGDDAGAEDCYQRVLAQAPDMPVVHWQRAQARLRAGDLGEGWREYEWRWRMPGFGLPAPLREMPVWDGVTDLPGRRLLVHAEQGHGDSLQFIRYVPLLRARGIDIHVQVQPALVRLFRFSLDAAIGVGALGEPVPTGFALRCPLLGLPLRLGTDTVADIPAHTPYLSVPEQMRAAWRARLQALPGLRVGLVWAGDGRASDPRAAATDRRRSLSLSQLAALGGVPGLSLISLQKGPRSGQAAEASFPITDWTDELSDFADTAALVSELDLVIGVDTAVIHLSGALGRPTWVLSRFDGCWRWLRNREDNPWYHRLRLFRQEAWALWSPAVDKLVNALELWSSEKENKIDMED